MLPRFAKYTFPSGYIFQCRWGKFGYDIAVSPKGFRLLQWGKRGQRATRFLCYVPKTAAKLPLFLLSPQWKTHYHTKTIMAGETTKPFSPRR